MSTGAQVLARAVRSHWAVENELHWSLDVGFREDDCQVRKDNAPANLACVRRMALTQLKQEYPDSSAARLADERLQRIRAKSP